MQMISSEMLEENMITVRSEHLLIILVYNQTNIDGIKYNGNFSEWAWGNET